MKAGNKTVGTRLRIVLEPDIAIGPGKADILEGVRETGSIAAAGRRMGMSYKRAWTMVDVLNHSFGEPLVETCKGGARGGGARLTARGEEVLTRYRRIEALAEVAVAEEIAALRAMLRSRGGGAADLRCAVGPRLDVVALAPFAVDVFLRGGRVRRR